MQSIFGPAGFIGISTTAPSGTSLYVAGNVFASNALSTPNINVVTLNTTTANLQSIFGPAGFIGIGTTAPSGTSLYVAGNVVVTNTLTTVNLVVTGSLSYPEDLTKRSPYLRPDASNAATIQAWISATCNAAGQPTKSWWATSQAPVFGNVATGPSGSSDYSGSVLLPDGRVLFVPNSASNVGFYNPVSGLFSTVTAAGLTAVANKFRGGVLVPNGNVVFIPSAISNIGMFNPLTYAYSNIAVGAQGGTFRFQGGVLGPTGNVVMVPRDSANIGVFNPTTLVLTNVGPISGSTSLFGSGVLLPNGNVVMTPMNTNANIGMYNTYSLATSGFSNVGPIATNGYLWETSVLAPNGNVIFLPSTSANIVVYNPSVVTSPLASSAFSNVPFIGAAEVGSKNFFQGSVLLPSGNVICCPADASNVGMFDPQALTYSNSVAVSSATLKFFGATLLPTGQVVFCPYNSANVGALNTFTPVAPEFCLSPYFNKY